MADVEQSIVSLLSADSDITDLVGARIVPDQLAQGDTLPAIAYRVISSEHAHNINGAKAGARFARVTIESYATTRIGANALAELVRLSGILDWSGSAHGVDVLSTEIDSGAFSFTEQNTEGSHELRYVTSYDFKILYRESV
jgi:hypothetical protein